MRRVRARARGAPSSLAHVDLDGTSIVDLAERSNIGKQAASKLADMEREYSRRLGEQSPLVNDER